MQDFISPDGSKRSALSVVSQGANACVRAWNGIHTKPQEIKIIFLKILLDDS
jgi:hypothetical protein